MNTNIETDNAMHENISSSEMTAYWRSEFPYLSYDNLSIKLASAEGIHKAHLFADKYSYPLIGRKISVRAGWCLEQAVNLLLTRQYDSCVSLGSGFSLLTYCIANQIPKAHNIQFLDVDLENIITTRNLRINALVANNTLDFNTISRINTLAINLEHAYQSGVKFNELFGKYKHPVFIIEGIIYFLSKDCVQWIFDGIATYSNHGVIFDYWPDNAHNKSQCFRRVLSSLGQLIPEQIQGLMSTTDLDGLCKSNSTVIDVSLQDIENNVSQKHGESPQFINPDEFIPVRLRVATG